ncbi:transglutaminase-like domain-containing protein [Sabulilitoribacter multivorans]|uniref:Transglutaminase-like domain-containing protein n=1 Tax=Flaviramulus multivorans TaxID=1304750 RepID=A0ABS9IGD3_9FLAO|nr:transglutaminase-like domain-containing protein [Flaviramulus multivorans]MCF7559819.1 transglutaminase-like domain-containing protein [Flaviramulus multivorans]
MIWSLKKLILSIFYIVFYVNGFAQNLAIKTISEDVLINKDTSFVKHVSVLLKKSDKLIIYPIFYDTELEELSDIQLYIRKGKHFKLLRNNLIGEEDVKLDYITSKKIKTIRIPSETEAKITYTIKCRELMYFSNLHFFSNDEIDTLKYQITIPNTFRFAYDTIYEDSLDYLAIDSIKLDGLTKWNIEATPKKVEEDLLMLFGIYKNIKEPLMRVLIIPANYENNERKYMNDWYFNKLKTRRGLNFVSSQKIDELTKGVLDPLKIIDTLYSYVKNNFKYVAIEIGMGAFVPTHVNEVFTNKEGDCKDLSNFLSEALNYKGIRSEVALAATYNHISDCDFPSLSSANHVVCLAYIDGKPIILDPTDPIHLPETPVQSIQKRSILIINSKEGEYYNVPSFSSHQNLISYNIDLEVDSNQMLMNGDFRISYEGISGNFLKREFLYLSKDRINNIGKKHYEFVFGNESISSFKIQNDKKKIEAEGIISINGKLFRDGNNRLLFIDFLPRIIETVDRESLLEGTHLGSPFSKKVNVKIKLDEPFQMFNSIEHTYSNEGVSLLLKISSPTESIIECNYEFDFDYIIIDKENVDITNKILTSFKEIINEPIIFQKKS